MLELDLFAAIYIRCAWFDGELMLLNLYHSSGVFFETLTLWCEKLVKVVNLAYAQKLNFFMLTVCIIFLLTS